MANCIENQISKFNVEKSPQPGQSWCGGQPIAESLSEKGYYFNYSIQENKVQLTDDRVRRGFSCSLSLFSSCHFVSCAVALVPTHPSLVPVFMCISPCSTTLFSRQSDKLFSTSNKSAGLGAGKNVVLLFKTVNCQHTHTFLYSLLNQNCSY